MKILLDMNLSPEWGPVFERHGWLCVHWSQVGDPRAPDRTIMQWALENGYVVFTHDLDFGAILAATHALGPSVIQVRIQDIWPSAGGSLLTDMMKEHESALEAGALIVVDVSRARVRILPLQR